MNEKRLLEMLERVLLVSELNEDELEPESALICYQAWKMVDEGKGEGK
jgi:hypothetical protein